MIQYAPLNESEREVITILERLRKGLPLGSLDRNGTIIRRGTDSPESRVKALVAQARSLGAVSRRDAVWIVGPRGGGKTERLSSLNTQLLVEEGKELGKSAMVALDLKDTPRAVEEGLQAEIFARLTGTRTSPFLQKFGTTLADAAATRPPAGKGRENVVGLGFDILFALSNVAVPGASTVAALLGNGLLDRVQQKLKVREGRLRKQLQARGVTDDAALELAVRWIRFAVQPTQQSWTALQHAAERRATAGSLFHLVCHLLQAAGYSTLVILVDEVDRIIEKFSATQSFERLWDLPKPADPYHHKLNVIFVLAVSTPVDQLRDESKYSGFSRRFMGTRESPAPTYALAGPRVTDQPGSNDDCTHAISTITGLIANLTNVAAALVTEKEQLKLRKRLMTLADKDQMTWHELWAAVSAAYNPLV